MSRIFVAVFLAVLVTSCSDPKPTAIAYGKDQCTECKMAVSDAKYGAEVLMQTGLTYTFDSPECMLAWYAKGTVPANKVHSLWVTDFIRPGELIDARKCFFLESTMFHSPMGLNYAAFRTTEEMQRAQYSYPGTPRTFNDALTAAKE